MPLAIVVLFCSLFILTRSNSADTIVPGKTPFLSDFLTFGLCDSADQCAPPRLCIYEYAGHLSNCGYALTNCLCVPPEFQLCSSSSDCVLGEQCVSTKSSSDICVSCVAADNILTFRAVDQPSLEQCTLPRTTPLVSLEFTPTPIEPSPDPIPLPSPDSDSFEKGYAMDSCHDQNDCAVDSYTCRDLSNPLHYCGGRDDYSYFDCVCVPSSPTTCSHIDQCPSGEFCLSGLESSGPNSRALCISKRLISEGYGFNRKRWIFFPTDSNPFPALSATPILTPSFLFEPSGLLQPPVTPDSLTPSFRVSPEPSLSSSVGPGGEPTDPVISDDPFVYPSESVTPEFSPNKVLPDYPSGWTLDRCKNTYDCKDDRSCINAFGKTYSEDSCAGQCYCLPVKLQVCTSSSQCTDCEVCVTAYSVEKSYCVSRKAVENNPVFEILPYDDGSYSLPFVPSLFVSETPLFGSFDPVYIPPGYPEYSASPEFSGAGLTLSYCMSSRDCAGGYECIAVQFAPCSWKEPRCICVPAGGTGGTVCITDAQCQNGETCFPTNRIDIVPSYCVSKDVASRNLKILKKYLDPIVPRGVGLRNWRRYFRDWDHSTYIAQKSVNGTRLTGDKCRSSSDCATGRVCADSLKGGKLCDENRNCTDYAYCYPRTFDQCISRFNCEYGEICTVVEGLYYDSTFNAYSPRRGVQTICLSSTAARRNGYTPLPYPSGLPQKFLKYIAWENAEDILQLKFRQIGSPNHNLSEPKLGNVRVDPVKDDVQ